MSPNAAALLFWSKASTGPVADDAAFCSAAAFRWAQALISAGC